MLLDLPLDIKLAILSFLAPHDIFCLKHTCRALYTLGSQAYVWHQVKLDLPLDLPSQRDFLSLTGLELQRIMMKGLQLDRNWQVFPGVPKIRSIGGSALVDKVQILGSDWIVTLCRPDITTYRLSVWPLKNFKGSCVAETHLPRAIVKFSATLRSDMRGAIATVEYHSFPGTAQIGVYSFALDQGTIGDSAYYCANIARPRTEGTYFDIQICEDIVAACYARSLKGSSVTQEVILVNTTTDAQWTFRDEVSLHLERLHVRLLPDRIVFVGSGGDANGNVLIKVYTLPSSILTNQCTEQDSPTLIAQYKIPGPYNIFELYITTEHGSTDAKHLSVMLFPNVLQQTGQGCHITIPLGPQSCDGFKSLFFEASACTSVHNVCIGASGKRAVWLCHNWDTDDFELVKGHFPSEGRARVGPLLPQNMAVPFRARRCHGIAFDEASGRMFVLPEDGGLYVLYF